MPIMISQPADPHAQTHTTNYIIIFRLMTTELIHFCNQLLAALGLKTDIIAPLQLF